MPSDPRIREIWRSMHKRCGNPACKDYAKYAGNRVKVCGEWHTYEGFERWALTHGYAPDKTLDRVNNNALGYCPGNCRWVSRKTQGMNRTTAARYTCDGRTRSLQEWSEETGLSPSTITRRLGLGWGV